MAAPGGYFSPDSGTLLEERRKISLFIFFQFGVKYMYLLHWDLTKLRAFTSFLFEGLGFQGEKPGRGVASRPAIW